WTFTGDRIRTADKQSTDPENDPPMTYKLEPGKKHKAIDLTVVEGRLKGMTFPGIYAIDGDTLKICFDRALVAGHAAQRPTAFATRSEDTIVLFTLKRQTAAKTLLEQMRDEADAGQRRWSQLLDDLDMRERQAAAINTE